MSPKYYTFSSPHFKTFSRFNFDFQEEVLANFLIEIDPALFSLKGKLELCKIVETLQQKPSKMSLNGYVIVEKKVIPKVVMLQDEISIEMISV